MARPDTWMPMYWRDFWADTSHLSPVEGWAYLNLIGAYWTSGGPLPNDDARLCRQARVSAKEWRKIRPTVIAFFAVDDKRINHRRIDDELLAATTAYNKRRAHIDRVNSNRTQSPPTVTAPRTETVTATQPQPQPHSPDGEKKAKPAPKPKGSRLANDWKPNEETRDAGRELGLTDAEISAELSPGGPFFDHFQSDECDRPVRPGWDLSARKWLRRGAAGIIARRPRGQQSVSNRHGPESIIAAGAAVVSRLQAHEGFRRDGGGDVDEAADVGQCGAGDSIGGGEGEILDATDDLERDRRAAHSA